MLVEQLIDVFVREIFGTRRKDVIRLIITEGPRFPELAEFYYREVIARVLDGDARACCARAVERGELPTTRWCAFRSSSSRPAWSRIIWSGLFDRSSRSTCAR